MIPLTLCTSIFFIVSGIEISNVTEPLGEGDSNFKSLMMRRVFPDVSIFTSIALMMSRDGPVLTYLTRWLLLSHPVILILPAIFLTSIFHLGGAEKITHDIVTRLNKDKYEPVFCTLYQPGEGGAWFINDGYRFYHNLMRNKFDIFVSINYR